MLLSSLCASSSPSDDATGIISSDIGRLAAMALTDDRTFNKCVQLDFNMKTQRENIDLLKKYYPEYPFEYEHFSSEFITEKRNTATDEVTAKKGAETDKDNLFYTILRK